MDDRDWVPTGESHTGCGYTVYNVKAQVATERISLGNSAWLLMRDIDGLTYHFAVFQLLAGDASDGTPDEHIMLFHGTGPSGALRCPP